MDTSAVKSHVHGCDWSTCIADVSWSYQVIEDLLNNDRMLVICKEDRMEIKKRTLVTVTHYCASFHG